MAWEIWVGMGTIAVAVPGAILATLKLRERNRPSRTTSNVPDTIDAGDSPEIEILVDDALTAESTDGSGQEIADPEPEWFELDELAIVEPGALVGIDIPVSSGVRIKVRLEADETFEYDLCTERNYVRMVRGEDSPAIRAGHDERAYLFAWTARGKGPWTLVLSANGRRNVREVHVKITQVL